MSQDDITPARLRELADKQEFYAGVETTRALGLDTAAALRAAADQLVAERETNGATALLLQQARDTLAAREALHGKDIGAQRTTRSVAIAVCVALGLDLPRHIDAAEQAINAELDFVGLDYDTAIVVQPRALAAEIAAALKETDNERS